MSEVKTDIYSREKRSEIMSRVRSQGSKPEKLVRSLLHRRGYRFRLNRKELPGKPDMVLSKYKTVVFVHGCFWHQHPNCKKAKKPKSNISFWQEKLEKNFLRDLRVKKELEDMGWYVLVVWTFELNKKNITKAIDNIDTILQSKLGEE